MRGACREARFYSTAAPRPRCPLARGEGRIAITYRKGSARYGYFLNNLRNNTGKKYKKQLYCSANDIIKRDSVSEVTSVEYKTVKEMAEDWGLSERRVRLLCQNGEIDGVVQNGRAYLIPETAVKPVDKRYRKNKNISPLYRAIFAKIDELKHKLNLRRPLTQGELKRLQEEFMIEFTYDSNAIEGNTLTLQETAMVLEGITIDTKPLKDHLDVVGHKEAFGYVKRIVAEKTSFSERVIQEIHSLVLMDRPEDRGRYRRIPVRIMGASHEPPQPYLVPIQMEQLIDEVKKEQLHPIEAAALFHLKFEGIHPFIDGNGRTGRLILNFMLMQNGYPPINVKFADRRNYYEGFETYYKNGDSAPMVKMIAQYIEEQLNLYLRILAAYSAP